MPSLPPTKRRPWQPVPPKREYTPHKARTSAYNTARWQALRKQVMSEQPICAEPGCGKPSKAADHITPVRLGGGMWERSNLQGLCWSHHQAKSGAEGRLKAKEG